MQKIAFLSGNTLKLIAAAAMVVDHMGVIFFPDLMILRMIGRLSFPIFAFMISEGCKHTRNRWRYFLTMAGLATCFQIVYFFALGSLKMSIFVTFSLSILMIYALDLLKESIFNDSTPTIQKILAPLLFFGSIVAVFLINRFFDLDYNFAGCMTPVFASIFHSTKSTPEPLRRLDNNYLKVLALSIGLLWLAFINLRIQFLSLLTLPLLLMYSGKRGKWKLKYFFYVFYPAHLVILYGISILIK
jgi:hypothetical protein